MTPQCNTDSELCLNVNILVPISRFIGKLFFVSHIFDLGGGGGLLGTPLWIFFIIFRQKWLNSKFRIHFIGYLAYFWIFIGYLFVKGENNFLLPTF